VLLVEHPLPYVEDNVYVVFDVGLAVGLRTLVALNPVAGDHVFEVRYRQ
jgi:hypothetical protein